MMIDSRLAAVRRRWLAPVLAMVTLAGLSACRADDLVAVSVGGGNQTVVATPGQEIEITLGNVGPATYASPPTISSNAITFLGVDVVGPVTPAGPHQRFRFRAAESGVAVVTFRRVLGDSLVSTVQDTIQVR